MGVFDAAIFDSAVFDTDEVTYILGEALHRTALGVLTAVPYTMARGGLGQVSMSDLRLKRTEVG
jgi:hypothetical protein